MKEKREKRGAIAAQMAALCATSPMTDEQRAQFAALDTEQASLLTEIQSEERAAALVAETTTTVRPPNGAIEGQQQTQQQREADTERYMAAWRSYMKNGLEATQYQRGVKPEDRDILFRHRQQVGGVEARDMGEGGPPFGAYPGSTTGFFVPVGFVNKVESAMKWFGDMLGVATVMETATGQPLPFPTDNDTGTIGELVGENSPVSTADVSLGQITFGAFKFSTKMVKVSMELLQDSAFDLDSFLAQKFGMRLGRILNNKFTVGAGTTEPTGIVTAATVGLGQGTTPAIFGDDNAVSPDPTQQVGYIDLTNVTHSVDKAYRPYGKFMMHDLTLRYIKTLKDKYGHPLWVPGMAVGAPDTILGYAYSINNDMAQLGASNKTVIFGDLTKYLIRRVKDLSILRLTERYAELGQVAFIGFARYDGNLLDAGTHPVKFIQQHS